MSEWDHKKECYPGGALKNDLNEREKMRDIIRLIENDGWCLLTAKGSHRQYKHPEKPGRVTIAGHMNDDISPGTLSSIKKQADLER
jgi:predicted RNA binding protein YcfA (HicA-like mRNA interferase family)